MKTIYLLLCALALCSLQSSRSDDACCESATSQVETRLREIDTKALLSMYEQYRTECAKAQVTLQMLRLDIDEPDADQQKLMRKLDQRIRALESLADQTRALALKLGGSTSVAAK
jgi:hypothetical protein